MTVPTGKTDIKKQTAAKKPLPEKKPKKTIRREKAVELVVKGELTQQEAADISGYSNQRISQLVQEYKTNTDTILFSENKDKVFESLQSKIVSSIGDDDLKRASLSQKVLATAVIQDKIQALRGQASSISLQDIRILIETRPVQGKVEGRDAVPLIESAEYEESETKAL